MSARASILTPSVARGIAVTCAAAFVASAHIAPAAINVWTSHGPEAAAVTALAIDPSAPSTLYAGAIGGDGWGGVFKSTDGGNSWNASNTGLPGFDIAGGITVLAIDSRSPTTLYAGTEECGEGRCIGVGVFRSTDGGSTWSAANTGLPEGGVIGALALDPTASGTLFAAATLTCRSRLFQACDNHGLLFKSTDGGSTWNAANAGLEAGAVRALALDPLTSGTLYAGTGGVVESTDGGDTWSPSSLPGYRVTALALAATDTLYAATSGGVFKTIDRGNTWSAANTGLNDFVAYGGITVLAIDPWSPTTLYAGTNGDDVFKSTDGAISWVALSTGLTNHLVTALAIDPTRPSTLYAGTLGGGVFEIEQAAAAKVVGTGTAASCTDAALNAALTGGGLVTFDCGPDPVTIDISTGTGTKMITADTIIDGGGLITISGGDTVGVFIVNSGVIVRNLTIANGGSCGTCPGCGVACNRAIENYDSLTVATSTFIGNRGGGIVNRGNGPLTVTDSTFTDNGSGIINRGSGSLTVANSTFTGNGAVGNDASGVVTNHEGGMLTVTNGTFSGNGNHGIFNEGALTVTNCTFIGNSEGGFGVVNNGGGPVLLRDTVVANSPFGDNCYGAISDGGHNLDSGTSCGFSTANGSLSGTDPQLDPAGLQHNGGPTETVALCTGVDEPVGCVAASPAIDGGDQVVCDEEPVGKLDQRGFARPGAGHTQCSIGAYEADATVPEACAGDCSGTQIVAVSDLIALVNIDLGNAETSACPHGIPGGARVDIALLIRAVGNALTGCASGQ